MTTPRSPKLPAPFTLIALDCVGSTNAEARRLALEGEETAPDGTLVWALEQTEGRGRRGRTWVSPRGNFYSSLVLRPEVPIAEAAQVGFVACIAVYDAVGDVAEPGFEARLKWPNDILLFGKKVGGMLLEAESDAGGGVDFVILGLGVNLLHHPDDTEFPATSFRAEGTLVPDVYSERIAQRVCHRASVC